LTDMKYAKRNGGSISPEYPKAAVMDVDIPVRRTIHVVTDTVPKYPNEQHILPTGFSKIRYFGFMALSVMKTNFAQCYTLIGQRGCLPVLQGLTGQEVFRMVTGIDPLRCTSCKTGIMRPFGIRTNDTG
jgi:hypothetical protein